MSVWAGVCLWGWLGIGWGSTDDRRQRTVIGDVVILDLYPWPPRLNSNCVITFKIQFQTQLTRLAALLREGVHMVVGCSLLAKIAPLTISVRTALSLAYLLGTICSLLTQITNQPVTWQQLAAFGRNTGNFLKFKDGIKMERDKVVWWQTGIFRQKPSLGFTENVPEKRE